MIRTVLRRVRTLFPNGLKRVTKALLLRNVLDVGSETYREIEASESFKQLIGSLGCMPRISILIPVYNTDPDILRACLDSVCRQVYRKWELCIVNDASTLPHVRGILTAYAVQDHRIRVVHAAQNGGIAATINRAAAMATGQFIGVLDHDDELHPAALFEYVRLISRHPEADCIYCDEDKIDAEGRHCDPWHKSDYNPDLLLSFNYVMHFVLLRRSLFKRVGGVRRAFEGSQDYDLILRVSEATDHIYHIPKILYHWRMGAGSIASGPEAKPAIFQRGLNALNAALVRRGIDGVAEDAPDAWKGVFRVRRRWTGSASLSVAVWVSDGEEAAGAVLENLSRYLPAAETEVLVCGSRMGGGTADGSRHPFPVHYVMLDPACSVPEAFNLAAHQAHGEYLLLMDDRLRFLDEDGCGELMQQIQRPQVGAAAGKVYHPDGRIEHAGTIFGPFGLMGYAHRATPDTSGYAGLKSMIGNCSAVMGFGMVTRRRSVLGMGGFDPAFARAYWDADYCLRLGAAGYRITYTPYARLVHHLPVKTIGEMVVEPEATAFRQRWPAVIAHDPYFNPNFSRSLEAFVPESLLETPEN